MADLSKQMIEHSRRICDVQPGDAEFVQGFENHLVMLLGLVEEMHVSHPSVLLSPIMRELLVEKKREVARMFDKIRGRIVVDNPGEPLMQGNWR